MARLLTPKSLVRVRLLVGMTVVGVLGVMSSWA